MIIELQLQSPFKYSISSIVYLPSKSQNPKIPFPLLRLPPLMIRQTTRPQKIKQSAQFRLLHHLRRHISPIPIFQRERAQIRGELVEGEETVYCCCCDEALADVTRKGWERRGKGGNTQSIFLTSSTVLESMNSWGKRALLSIFGWSWAYRAFWDIMPLTSWTARLVLRTSS